MQIQLPNNWKLKVGIYQLLIKMKENENSKMYHVLCKITEKSFKKFTIEQFIT